MVINIKGPPYTLCLIHQVTKSVHKKDDLVKGIIWVQGKRDKNVKIGSEKKGTYKEKGFL